MKAILATVIAASLAIGCGVIEEEQTTTEIGGTTRTGGETSSSSITPEFTELLGEGQGRGVTIDQEGNFYVIGNTTVGLDENTHSGATCTDPWNSEQDPFPCTEVFVMKFDSHRNKLWTRQFGTLGGHSTVWGTSSMAVDTSGNVFVEGLAQGGMNDQSHSGYTMDDGPDGSVNVPGLDPFLIKLDNLGATKWTIQKEPEFVGTSNIATDSQGSIYTRWNYEDLDIPTLTKHQDNGTELWNTPMIQSEAIAVDSSDYLYAAGQNIEKYDPDGNIIWSNQLYDTSLCSSPSVALSHLTSAITFDGMGNTYVSGWTNIIDGACTDSMNKDAFLMKFDSEGELQWSRQYGEEGQQDWGAGSATDVHGNTFMLIESPSTSGGQSSFTLVKYDAAGNLVAEKPLDATKNIFAGFTTDNNGGVYITGADTESSWKIFLRKINL
jgi:hypothetical protein